MLDGLFTDLPGVLLGQALGSEALESHPGTLDGTAQLLGQGVQLRLGEEVLEHVHHGAAVGADQVGMGAVLPSKCSAR